MTGSFPDLKLRMFDTRLGREISEADVRGKIVVLEFGYTLCPDICPTTLSTLTGVLRKLGKSSEDVRVLFVSVDPDRDGNRELAQYADNFARQVHALRGSPNALAFLARRYRAAYSVKHDLTSHAPNVMHTTTLYVFDRTGKLRLLAPDISNAAAIEHDLRQLLSEA